MTKKQKKAEVNKSQGANTALQRALTDPGKSAFVKYQEVVLGSSSMLYLVKYEILTCLIGFLPGAVGLLLRKKLYRTLLGKVGHRVVFGRSLTLRHPQKIYLGNNVIIDDYAVLDAKGSDNKGIVIGDNVIIGRNTVISCKNGNIVIGDNTNIAMNCFIQSGKRVTIGKNVLFAAYAYVIGGGDHETDRTDIPIISQGQVIKGITIEDNCWIGAAAKILDGVSLGKDCIVGAGAVVTRSVPEFTVIGGVPARRLRSRI